VPHPTHLPDLTTAEDKDSSKLILLGLAEDCIGKIEQHELIKLIHSVGSTLITQQKRENSLRQFTVA